MFGNQFAGCPACGSGDRLPLPAPAEQRALLSDGAIIATTLSKISCMRCGVVTYSEPPSANVVSGWYGSHYTLNAFAPDADRFALARAANYAKWLSNQWGARPPPASVFEIGCGNATLLSKLRELWPSTRFSGIEAAPAAAAQARAAGFEVVTGHFPKVIPLATAVDLVVSVNVIEHVSDPVKFLLGVSQLVGREGVGFIVCPDGDRPNIDLLFADHLYSLTAAAFSHFARYARLCVHAVVEAPAEIGMFVLHILEPLTEKTAFVCDSDNASSLVLHGARVRLIEQWRQLDRKLAARLDSAIEVTAFGVGEAAAMLRAYAPLTWSMVKRCTADVVVREHFGDLPVLGYGLLRETPKGVMLLAVQPATQSRLASQLEADGWTVVTWADLVGLADTPHQKDGA